MQISSIVLGMYAVLGLRSCDYVHIIWEVVWNLLQLHEERHYVARPAYPIVPLIPVELRWPIHLSFGSKESLAKPKSLTCAVKVTIENNIPSL